MENNDQKEKISKLLKDPWHAHVITVLKETHGDPLPDLIEKGFIEAIENGNVSQKQIVNWVGNLSRIGETIENGQGSGSDLSVFWIRLHELLDYLPKYFAIFEDLNVYRGVEKLVQEIKNSYSSEELIMIEYQRNCHSHIHQTGYKIKAHYNKGKLSQDGLFYKGKEKVELRKLIGEELRKYSINEPMMAKSYFQKTKNKIDQLWRDLKTEFKV